MTTNHLSSWDNDEFLASKATIGFVVWKMERASEKQLQRITSMKITGAIWIANKNESERAKYDQHKAFHDFTFIYIVTRS